MRFFYLFYNCGIGKYGRFSFSKELVHSDLLCYAGDPCILFEIAPAGFAYRILRSNDVNKNLEAIKKLPVLSAFIAVVIKEKKRKSKNGPSNGTPVMRCVGILVVLILVRRLIQSISIKNY